MHDSSSFGPPPHIAVRHRLVVWAFALATSGCLVGFLAGCSDDGSLEATNAKPTPDAGANDADVGTDVDAPDATQPACEPATCDEFGAECGAIPDGCGGKVNCGDCPEGLTCGGDGTNACGTNACSPRTCAEQGAQCGWVSDGCSEAIECGGCAPPETCGGSGEANACGCTPKTCAQLGVNCGAVLDGCGGIQNCGTCSSTQVCGGGGANVCGSSSCEPKSCSQLGASCGLISDGCSDVIECGECVAPHYCGGGGQPNLCGCTPKTCAQVGSSCGTVDTGCGPVDCGSCSAPDTCGGGGVENQCGCTCELPNATTRCVAGECFIESCESGWDNCDGAEDNGCEANLDTDVQHCGACGTSCSFAHGSASCSEAVCRLASCNTGFDDCDDAPANGCEAVLQTDPDNCGTCGRSCSGACIEGGCEYTSPETNRKWDQSYKGSGALYDYNTHLNYQGYYLSSNGVFKSAIGAPDQMFADLDGAVVLDIWVYLYADHWYYFAGGTARIGVHGNATKPSTFPGINQDYAVGFERDEGKWVRLPSAWYDKFRSGAYRGITLHAGGSTAGQYYGYVLASSTKFKWKYRK